MWCCVSNLNWCSLLPQVLLICYILATTMGCSTCTRAHEKSCEVLTFSAWKRRTFSAKVNRWKFEHVLLIKMAATGHVGEFSPERETFRSYAERMDMFFMANNIVEEQGERNKEANLAVQERKRAVFLIEIDQKHILPWTICWRRRNQETLLLLLLWKHWRDIIIQRHWR